MSCPTRRRKGFPLTWPYVVRSDLVKVFIDAELVVWDNIQGLYGEALRQTKVFGPKGTAGVEGDIEEDAKHGKGDKRWQVLHDRIVEHVSLSRCGLCRFWRTVE